MVFLSLQNSLPVAPRGNLESPSSLVLRFRLQKRLKSLLPQQFQPGINDRLCGAVTFVSVAFYRFMLNHRNKICKLHALIHS